MLRILILIISMLLYGVAAGGEDFDHSDWDALLKKNVHSIDGGVGTQVDYASMLVERSQLQDYLKSLAAVSRNDFDSWSNDQQLAFLINVYNSWTVELILTRYPEIDSIKDLGSLFQSPWKKDIVHLFGEELSLDNVEHDLIRGSGRYNDPRIHFAVNCASIGCPALRPEAYRAKKLEQQLAEATSLFLSDRSRNRYGNDGLEVSQIFKWYGEDFEKGWLDINSLAQFFTLHSEELGLPLGTISTLNAGDIKITFLKYDWGLNRLGQ